MADQEAIKRAKAHKLLTKIGTQLHMRPHEIDEAKRVYALAQENNFVQGRHSSIVAGVALYIICRKQKIPQMLIDFADILKVSLYSLAACYIKLVKALQWCDQIPQIDPSLYIHRFCSKLEFGDKEREVSHTALRILQAFKKDWITQGRRPAGLCGAAIRIAANYHGFKRSTKQIVSVVKVCEETVKKRLTEFKSTPIGSLTPGGFEAIDFEKDERPSMDPPSFAKRELEMSKNLKSLVDSENIHKELENARSEMENELNNKEDSAKNEENNQEVSPENIPEEEKQLVLVPNIEDIILREQNKVVPWKSEDLSDIDDKEVEPYLLSDKEVRLKTIIWDYQNSEWNSKQSAKAIEDKKKPHEEKKAKRKKPGIYITKFL